MTIINTRPKSLSENLNKASSKLNIDILNIYMSEIIDTKEDNEIWEPFIKNISDYKNIIFLSQTSVAKGVDLIGKSHDLVSLENNFYSVGERTSAALKAIGVESTSPKNQSAAGLYEMIDKNTKSLIFCGKHSNNYLQSKLQANADTIYCFELIYNKSEILKIDNKNADVILIFNSLTFKKIFEYCEIENLLNKKFLFASQSIFAKAQNICHDSKIQGMELYFQDEFNDGSILTRALSLT
jgi:uroporphyrinogen-III synthase